nr:MAG TPA: Chromatin remodeling complex ATPase [Caudoviricetes sp.]
MKFVPHPYQEYAITRILDTPHIGLFLDMGLGKTVSALTAVDKLINDRFEVQRVLVIAPLRVAKLTWAAEVDKWDHLNLKVTKVLGGESKRLQALAENADIYVINRENVPWLVDLFKGKRWPFDMVIIDESSSFKNPRSLRFRALRKVLPQIKRMVLLTGTPSPRSLMDLWPQLYLLDRGERLGRTLTAYRSEYFRPGKSNGFTVFEWLPNKDAQEKIHKAIGDICVSMSAADWLDIPEKMDNIIEIELPTKARKIYDTLKRDYAITIQQDDITAVNAAVLTGKLLQVANGALYHDDKTYTEIHKAKIDALKELAESATTPAIVFYWLKSDLERLKREFPNARTLDDEKDLTDWNNGKIDMLLLHPSSAGHGLNLQAGGHTIVWFGLTWSLELYQQANARLHRQGQRSSVIVHHILARDTMDERVLKALQQKRMGQDSLLAAVRAEIF